MMTSRERILAAIDRQVPDHIPLMARCFGFAPPAAWTWQRAGEPVKHWFTGRLEHIHTIPEPWRLPEDDFRRVEAWLSLGVDDMIDVSVPWGIHPDVTVRDYHEVGTHGGGVTIACREYDTPDGLLTHKVRLTREKTEPGWVVQPEYPPLFEDYNIPRATEPLFTKERDLPKLKYLLAPPSREQLNEFRQRMTRIRQFADDKQVAVAAWSLFGMDGVVWLCGAENGVIMAMTEPDLFAEIVRIVDEFDRMRTELMLDVGGVDLIVQRGWYSSTDFWSPSLFEQHVLPCLKRNVDMVHAAGKRFAYVMTTGVKPLLHYLSETNVDVWYWADPEMGDIDNATIRSILGGKVAVAGGIDAARTLHDGSPETIRRRVVDAIEILGPDGLILEAMDSLFPDTPASSVETMIDIWKELVL
jgi:uroporphyrinogen-III decarboxylase